MTESGARIVTSKIACSKGCGMAATQCDGSC